LDLNRITERATSKIDFATEKACMAIHQELNLEVFGALSPITINTIKYAATVLFRADCETQNAPNVLELFELPNYIPSCIRLTPFLQRKKGFKKEGCKEYQQLVMEFKPINDAYIAPAKAIMLKDKRLVLCQAQHTSKQFLLQQLLRVVQSVVSVKLLGR
jgi:hypothetical protein